MKWGFKSKSHGPSLEKPSDLPGLLTNLNEHDVLFIDEIHRLNPVIEEYSYSAMEDYAIDIILDTGPNARTIQIKLNPLPWLGRRRGRACSPPPFGPASASIYVWVIIMCRTHQNHHAVGPSFKSPNYCQSRWRNRPPQPRHPRIANNLLRRTRDFADIKGDGVIINRLRN